MLLRTTRILVLAFIAAAVVPACAKDTAETPVPQGTATSPAEANIALTRIEDPKLVCMVNDTYMGKAQIPVEVDGKTYFGCCPACKERLANEPGVRTALDPVTGETVDKATAVLAQDASGTVHYFASAQHLRSYRPAP